MALRTDSEMLQIATSNGILIPAAGHALEASKAAQIPMAILCAFLMQETGGGKNIYGHDVDKSGNPRPFWGHGQVTRANYTAYKIERDLGVREPRFAHLGRRMQGVGPMQLTWYTYQDDADKAGGCWRSDINILIAARILRNIRVSEGVVKPWTKVALTWNGSSAYVDQIYPKFNQWRELYA